MSDAHRLVHEGLDGWLFLTGGANFVTTLYDRHSGHLPDAKLERWHAIIKERVGRCRELGIDYVHVVVPEKLTIYGHKQSSPLVDPDLAPAVRLGERFANTPSSRHWIDLVASMRAIRDDIDLYWKTDTHWTAEGCLLAYEMLCEALSLEPNNDLRARPFREFAAIMDLGGKMNPVIWETIKEYEWVRDAERVYANRVTQILETPEYGGEIHVASHVKFANPTAANEKRLLLFGDSFSSPRSNLLTGLLAETVREVDFIWSANIDWRYVESVRPDILVSEMPERFMALAPNDRFHLRLTEAKQIARAQRSRLKRWWRARRSRGEPA
ncbi:MAG: hypothetical protein C3F11_01780 [Methylocystaceae bacterium]|nr:MAG: hypothetical protein C3F11_01780 [Methylocystaceae bacterium]